MFSNKKYLISITIQKRRTQINVFLIEKLGFNGFLKVIGPKGQLPITFVNIYLAIRH